MFTLTGFIQPRSNNLPKVKAASGASQNFFMKLKKKMVQKLLQIRRNDEVDGEHTFSNRSHTQLTKHF